MEILPDKGVSSCLLSSAAFSAAPVLSSLAQAVACQPVDSHGAAGDSTWQGGHVPVHQLPPAPCRWDADVFPAAMPDVGQARLYLWG